MTSSGLCPHCNAPLPQGAVTCLACGAHLGDDLARQTIEQRLMSRQDRLRRQHEPSRQDAAQNEPLALTCPQCGSQTFTDYGDGLVACQRCYTQFDLNAQQCPFCGALLAEGTLVCLSCGADLSGDLARQIIHDRLMSADDRRRLRHAQIRQVRTSQDESSRQRMSAWWQEEQLRRQTELEQQTARQRRERRFITAAMVAIFLIVALVVTLSLIFLPGGEPEPTPATWLPTLSLIAARPRFR
ncbi:MAG: zinc-ribbon domain-containing protein [Chloroflexota bacterium]